MKTLRYFFLLGLLLCSIGLVFAQSSDNGDGTFTNPVIWGDFPDPDVIRVGDTFYFISTSMHYFPGVTLLKSKDLVNWSIAANVVQEFKEHPYYDLNGGSRYAKGQWATAVRYFNGRFHVLFTTLTEGSYIYTATNAEGPWEKHKVENAFLYDPGLFVDRDNRVYVISGNTEIMLTELDPVTLQVKGESRLIYKAHQHGLEGNRCYHIGEYYYLYCTYGGFRAGQTCLRGKSLEGPFEEREVMYERGNYGYTILHQACLVDLPDGSYWSMMFQDRGGLGRLPYLVPIYWVDDWPLPGNPMNGILTMKKPVEGNERIHFPTTDEFNSTDLAAQWQFNHNPDKSKYSLSERKGYLRLHTATVTDSLLRARNTVCQRIIGPYSCGTAKIDISGMKRGDRAGLVILQAPFATLSVEKTSKGNLLQMTVNEEVKQQVRLKTNIVYLRAEVEGDSDWVHFFYSTDGISFQPLGEKFRMVFRLTVFCGNRYGLFNYATERLGGYIDVDWFRVEQRPLFSRTCGANKVLQAEWFDRQYRAETIPSDNDQENRNQDVAFGEGGLILFHHLEMTDVNLKAIDFTLKCRALRQGASIEVRNGDNGEILGRLALPETTNDGYETLRMALDKPLVSTSKLEIRVWNRFREGSIQIDKIMLVAVP